MHSVPHVSCAPESWSGESGSSPFTTTVLSLCLKLNVSLCSTYTGKDISSLPQFICQSDLGMHPNSALNHSGYTLALTAAVRDGDAIFLCHFEQCGDREKSHISSLSA